MSTDTVTLAEAIEERAERIIRMEGLMFALACRTANEDDLSEARRLLKLAIINSLVDAASGRLE